LNPQVNSVLKVALDSEHTRQSAAGIARYARGLADELRKRSDVELYEMGGGPVIPRGTLRKRLVTLRQDLAWYPWLGRRLARSLGADVYHSPLPRGPLTRGYPPFVVTVHDLAQIRFSETTTPYSRLYAKLTLRRVLHAADRIIADSNDTANDLNTLLRISPERIRVVPIGVDSAFFDESAPGSPGAEPYVLFVGTPEPRKNLDRLISAMALLRSRGSPLMLFLAGGGGWGPAVPDSPHVRRLGRVSDAQLKSLYAGASCLAIPSLHEGFGLPALEAMAAGAPVVAGNAGALPEITGGAAILVDPMSPQAIADGIDTALAERSSLVERGRRRARQFTWARTAEATLAVYREIA